MKAYLISRWAKKLIEPIEIEKSTASSVWINGRRNAKRTEYHNYFDTWADAHTYLLKKAEQSVESCRRHLEVEKGALGNIKGLREDS